MSRKLKSVQFVLFEEASQHGEKRRKVVADLVKIKPKPIHRLWVDFQIFH
jgi:hypothetical protein